MFHAILCVSQNGHFFSSKFSRLLETWTRHIHKKIEFCYEPVSHAVCKLVQKRKKIIAKNITLHYNKTCITKPKEEKLHFSESPFNSVHKGLFGSQTKNFLNISKSFYKSM